MHATSGDECFFFRLRSRDKGLTWELVSKELSAKAENISRTLNASRLPDGTLVYLSTGGDFAPMDQAEVLKKKTFILENAVRVFSLTTPGCAVIDRRTMAKPGKPAT